MKGIKKLTVYLTIGPIHNSNPAPSCVPLPRMARTRDDVAFPVSVFNPGLMRHEEGTEEHGHLYTGDATFDGFYVRGIMQSGCATSTVEDIWGNAVDVKVIINNGLLHGPAEMVTHDGNKYFGAFTSNCFCNGEGSFVNTDGENMSINWINGVAHLQRNDDGHNTDSDNDDSISGNSDVDMDN